MAAGVDCPVPRTTAEEGRVAHPRSHGDECASGEWVPPPYVGRGGRPPLLVLGLTFDILRRPAMRDWNASLSLPGLERPG